MKWFEIIIVNAKKTPSRVVDTCKKYVLTLSLFSLNLRTDAILLGHYRLSQDTDNQTKVFAVMTKKKEEVHKVNSRGMRHWLLLQGSIFV